MSGAPTPGRWEARADRHGSGNWGVVAVDDNNFHVIGEAFADIRAAEEGASEEARANAQLFAAARELLEVAEAALPLLRREFLQLAEMYAGTRYENATAYKKVEAAYRNARAAIARIRGETA